METPDWGDEYTVDLQSRYLHKREKIVNLTFIKILHLNSSKMRIFVYEHNDDEGSKTLLGMTELLLSRNWLRSEVTLILQP